MDLLPEKIILGHMAKSEHVAVDLRARLSAEMFTSALHSRVFNAIGELLDEGKRPSLPLLQGRLGDEDVDGVSVAVLIAIMIGASDDGSDPRDHADDLIQNYRKRRLKLFAQGLLKELAHAEADVDTLIAGAVEQVGDIAGRDSDQQRPFPQLLAQVVRGAEQARTGAVGGLDTGLVPLDEILGLLLPGDLGVIAGSPGDGKTILGCQLALHVAAFRHAAIFELEMDGQALVRRMLASEADMSAGDIEAGDFDLISHERLKAAEVSLARLNLTLVDRPKLTMAGIRMRCAALKRTRGLDLVVIDHLRLIRGARARIDKWERMEEAAEDCKALAKELQVAVVLLSQRTQESKRRDDPAPRLSDLDGGGALENFSDWAVGLFRRDLWIKATKLASHARRSAGNADEDPWLAKYYAALNKVELTTLKHRRRAPGQTRICTFNGKASRLEPPA